MAFKPASVQPVIIENIDRLPGLGLSQREMSRIIWVPQGAIQKVPCRVRESICLTRWLCGHLLNTTPSKEHHVLLADYNANTTESVLFLHYAFCLRSWRHQMETCSALLAFCARNSPHKGHWRWALMFSLICVWINAWVNNREAGDLRHHRTHYDVIAMTDCIRSQQLILFQQDWFCLNRIYFVWTELILSQQTWFYLNKIDFVLTELILSMRNQFCMDRITSVGITLLLLVLINVLFSQNTSVET